MSARLSALAAVALALALAACGFRPLYGKLDNGAPGGQAVFGSMYIPPIELENAGYELRTDLIDLLQAKLTPAGALYDLKINLRERNEPLAIQNEQVGNLKEVEITRYNYTLIAEYQLVDRKTRKLLTKGAESSLSAYNVVASPYATLMAEQTAQANTAQDIAQHLRIRLGVYFVQHAGQPQ